MNKSKFEVIPIAKFRPTPITVGDETIEYSMYGKLLGLKVTQRGILTHINDMLQQAKTIVVKLRRFKSMSEKVKVHLHKILLIPIIEYPYIPLNIIEKPTTELSKQVP